MQNLTHIRKFPAESECGVEVNKISQYLYKIMIKPQPVYAFHSKCLAFFSVIIVLMSCNYLHKTVFKTKKNIW